MPQANLCRLGAFLFIQKDSGMQFRSLQNHPYSDSIKLIGDCKPQLQETRTSSVLMAVTINRFLALAVFTLIFLTLAGQGHAQEAEEKRVNTGLELPGFDVHTTQAALRASSAWLGLR
jgi:hypothetical protein